MKIVGTRQKPTKIDMRRLRNGERGKAIILSDNIDKLEEQIDTLHDATVAMQSLDNLGSPEANQQAYEDMRALTSKCDLAEKKLNQLCAGQQSTIRSEKMEKPNYYIRCIEEFWPGQREELRTARIEIIDPNEHWPVEIGRITCAEPYFSWLYDKIENIRKEVIETVKEEENENHSSRGTDNQAKAQV